MMPDWIWYNCPPPWLSQGSPRAAAELGVLHGWMHQSVMKLSNKDTYSGFKGDKIEFSRLRTHNLWHLRLTFSLAGLGDGVHLVPFVAFAFEVAFVVDADLATGVRIFTLVNVCRAEREHGWPSTHGHGLIPTRDPEKNWQHGRVNMYKGRNWQGGKGTGRIPAEFWGIFFSSDAMRKRWKRWKDEEEGGVMTLPVSPWE